jgi:hypothetical protein
VIGKAEPLKSRSKLSETKEIREQKSGIHNGGSAKAYDQRMLHEEVLGLMSLGYLGELYLSLHLFALRSNTTCQNPRYTFKHFHLYSPAPCLGEAPTQTLMTREPRMEESLVLIIAWLLLTYSKDI